MKLFHSQPSARPAINRGGSLVEHHELSGTGLRVGAGAADQLAGGERGVQIAALAQQRHRPTITELTAS